MKHEAMKSNAAFNVVWLVVLVLGLVQWYTLTVQYSQIESDFVQDYSAGKAVLEGRSIYGEAIHEISSSIQNFEKLDNFHPPSAAIFYIPVAWAFSYKSAFYFSNFLSLCLYVVCSFLIARAFNLPRRFLIWFIPLSLHWWPFVFCTGVGQMSMIITFFITLAWYFLRDNREKLSGVCAAIPVALKLYPGLIALFFLMVRKKIAFTVWAGTVAAIALLTIAIVGIDDIKNYIFSVASTNVDEWVRFPINVSLDGLFASLVWENGWSSAIVDDVSLWKLLSVVSKLVCIILVIPSILKLYKLNKFDHAYGLVIVTMLLFSPITWSHIFMVLIMPLILLARSNNFLRSDGSVRLSVRSLPFILCFLLLSLPDIPIARMMMEAFSPNKVPWPQFAIVKGACFGLLLLSALLVKDGLSSSTQQEVI